MPRGTALSHRPAGRRGPPTPLLRMNPRPWPKRRRAPRSLSSCSNRANSRGARRWTTSRTPASRTKRTSGTTRPRWPRGPSRWERWTLPKRLSAVSGKRTPASPPLPKSTRWWTAMRPAQKRSGATSMTRGIPRWPVVRSPWDPWMRRMTGSPQLPVARSLWGPSMKMMTGIPRWPVVRSRWGLWMKRIQASPPWPRPAPSLIRWTAWPLKAPGPTRTTRASPRSSERTRRWCRLGPSGTAPATSSSRWTARSCPRSPWRWSLMRTTCRPCRRPAGLRLTTTTRRRGGETRPRCQPSRARRSTPPETIRSPSTMTTRKSTRRPPRCGWSCPSCRPS